MTSYNDKVVKLVLENTHKTTKYTSHTIQNEILHVLESKVRNKIRENIEDSKICIIVDEAHDESKREQIALVLRFINKYGFIQERFFDLVHVKNTSTLILKDNISIIFSCYSLDIQNIHGQEYDSASNMCSEGKILQTLFLNDCLYTYYIHCFTHWLQLALVVASREVIFVHEFFSNLNFIINMVGASCKLLDELQATQAA